MKTFNLKQFRSGRGLTLKVISEKTGIPPIHLSEIERGLRPISTFHLEKIKASFEADFCVTEERSKQHLSKNEKLLVQ